MQRFDLTVLQLVVLLLLPVWGCRPETGSALQERPDLHESPVSPVPDQQWNNELQAIRNGEEDTLIFDSQQLSEEQFRELLVGCASLKRLEVDRSRITEATLVEVFSALPALQRLRIVGQVSDPELKAIAQRDSLKILNLPDAQVSDVGLKSLEGHPHLELVRLHSPHVTNDGLVSLARLPALRFLHLIDVPINDSGLPALYQLTQLESFYLDGSDCTEEGLSRLIEHLPGLHFHWNQLHLSNDPLAHPH